MRNPSNNSASLLDCSNRDSLIKTNSVLISQLQSRLKAKRFRPQEADNIKQGYIRLLIQALTCQNTILKDTELDLLRAEIEELKELMQCQSKN